MKVLIINQYAGNKGDRAVAYLELRELLKNKKISHIYLSTNNPYWWKNDQCITQSDKIELIPWGWNVENFSPTNRFHWEYRRFMRNIALPLLVKAYNKNIRIPLWFSRIYTNSKFVDAIKTSDVIISTGGHHITTRFTPNFRSELFFDMLTASMYKKLILWSQTYGPLRFTNKQFEQACRKLINSAKIYVRDLESITELSRFGITSNINKTNETVIGLEDVVQNYVLPSKRKKIIGITIYNAESRTPKEYENYVQIMAYTADYLSTHGYKVRFFPHEIKNAVINDRKCIHDILNNTKYGENIDFVDNDLSTEEHLKELSECCMFIGHKTHSIVFALTIGTPLLAIAYHPKTKDFMKQYSLEDNIINESELSHELMIMKINHILTQIDEIGLKQREVSKMLGNKVRKDFASLINK